jgi:hypothetical protein
VTPGLWVCEVSESYSAAMVMIRVTCVGSIPDEGSGYVFGLDGEGRRVSAMVSADVIGEALADLIHGDKPVIEVLSFGIVPFGRLIP